VLIHEVVVGWPDSSVARCLICPWTQNIGLD